MGIELGQERSLSLEIWFVIGLGLGAAGRHCGQDRCGLVMSHYSNWTTPQKAQRCRPDHCLLVDAWFVADTTADLSTR